jgi:putative hydroxymethylpyrimidine transport system substrate-binding protein
MKSSSRSVLSLIFAALALCVVACDSKPKSPYRQVRVRLDWTPWAPHAAFYAALAPEQHYFRDELLSVNLDVPPDPEATIKLVAGGQDDFGISYMTDTILAREQGFKIVSVAALVEHPLNCIMTLKTSGLDKPSKLKGRVIGTTGVASDQAFLEGVLARGGVKKGDYKLVNIGFNLGQVLKSHQVDAIIGAYYPWEGIKMEEDGFPVNVIDLASSGVPDYYELVLVAREETLTKDPDLLRAFLRALIKGQTFVRAHPDQAVEVLRKVSPDLSSQFLSESLQKVLPLMSASGGEFRQSEGKWTGMIDFMSKSGLIKATIPASAAFTNRFLP